MIQRPTGARRPGDGDLAAVAIADRPPDRQDEAAADPDTALRAESPRRPRAGGQPVRPSHERDQVWPLSGFAAASLGRGLEREVAVVPCVLDPAQLPAPVERAELGLDPDSFLVVFVFDANRSIERKNPEGGHSANALVARGRRRRRAPAVDDDLRGIQWIGGGGSPLSRWA